MLFAKLRWRLRLQASADQPSGKMAPTSMRLRICSRALPVTGTLVALTQNSGWQAHAAAMDKAWKTKEYFQLDPIASWMGAHAGEYYRSSDTMYYMFSGPDFLYAYTFFPNANT